MKNLKTFLSICLIVSAIFLLVACDNGSKKPTDTDNQGKVSTTTTQTETKKDENAVYDESGNFVGYKKPEAQYPKKEIAGTITSDGVTYSNIYIEQRSEDQSFIIMTAKNNSTETILGQLIMIKLYTENSTEPRTLGGELTFIAPDSEAKVEVPAATDLMNVTRMEIEFYKP